ncbi:MAG: hypothetical protein Q9217_001704 [Psora testacea]
MQVAAIAMSLGDSVVWVDTRYSFVASRLTDIIRAADNEGKEAKPSVSGTGSSIRNLDRLHHFTTPTLSHLLALVIQPSKSFPPEDTSLLVIDSISSLFALAFPKKAEGIRDAQTLQKKSDAAQWASGRRWAVMGELISKLSRLAVTKDIAILLVTQSTTRVRPDTGALLHPAISGTAWDCGINNRIAFYRDWPFTSKEASSEGRYCAGLRFAGILKAKGMAYEGVVRAAAFTILKDGLCKVGVDDSDFAAGTSAHLPKTSRKRKRDQIADSESDDGDAGSDQEFGWGTDDEALRIDDLTE